MNGDGTLRRFADDELFTQPSAEIEWANFGRIEFIRARDSLKNPLTLGALGLRIVRGEPRLFLNPRKAIKNLIASGILLGRKGLGPYSEPQYITESRGHAAGCLDECRTIVTVYHIQARDFCGLMEFTRSLGHREGVTSLESVSSKDLLLKPLSGTFGHLTTNWQDRSYLAMAESMRTLEANTAHSTHRVFRLRDFPKLFDVEGK